MPIITQDKDKPNMHHVKFSEEELTRMPRVVDPEVPIIRYMNIPKFLALIVNQSIWFTRPDQFSDEFEGFSVINIEDVNAKENADLFRKRTYVNCWNWYRRESFHLWHIYGGTEKYGIGITSTVKQFKDSIIDANVKNSIEAFAIEYVEPTEIYEGINDLICATRKKNWYDYEEEVRFVKYKGSEFQEVGESVNINSKSLINEIILAPFVAEWFVNVIKSIIEKYDLDPSIVKRSEIRDTMLR